MPMNKKSNIQPSKKATDHFGHALIVNAKMQKKNHIYNIKCLRKNQPELQQGA